ncbi:MAG: putative Ig domain-containing protein, partial [Pseudomonadota bacterium]
PGAADVDTYNGIVIEVEDAAGASDALPAFSIEVTFLNDPPTISGTPDTSVDEDSAYSFTPSASDPDPGDTLTFSIENEPSWASFNTNNGTLSGTPDNGDVGTYNNIVITVEDAAEDEDSLPAFSISVVNTNDDPNLSGSPDTSVQEGDTYSFTPTLSDPDVGDTHTFSITNEPSWANFNTNTGQLSGTPGAADVDTYNGIVIEVEDAAGASDALPAFSIEVTPSGLPALAQSTQAVSSCSMFDTYGERLYTSLPAQSGDSQFALTADAISGVVEIDQVTGAVVYSPQTNERGFRDEFEYEYRDAYDTQQYATFELVVGTRRILLLTDGLESAITSTASADRLFTELFEGGHSTDVSSLENDENSSLPNDAVGAAATSLSQRSADVVLVGLRESEITDSFDALGQLLLVIDAHAVERNAAIQTMIGFIPTDPDFSDAQAVLGGLRTFVEGYTDVTVIAADNSVNSSGRIDEAFWVQSMQELPAVFKCP